MRGDLQGEGTFSKGDGGENVREGMFARGDLQGRRSCPINVHFARLLARNVECNL